jgi:purine-binding chemotaxis protein CheW
MSEVQMFCTFFLTDLLFAVDVKTVQEMIRNLEITPVPTSSPMVSGLINLRGQIITAIDARRCLNLPVRPVSEAPVQVILHADDILVSLLVDDVGDIVEFNEEQYESPPATLKGRLRDLICGAHKMPGRLLLVLDVRRMLLEISENLSTSAYESNATLNSPMGGERVQRIGALPPPTSDRFSELIESSGEGHV